MRERPILFNGDMVRAILAGTKTQTRRPAPINALSCTHHPDGLITWAVQFVKAVKGVLSSYSGGSFTEEVARSIIASQFCPFGQPGGRLWVRETWHSERATHPVFAFYRADGDDGKLIWRPSIHMPRWACRLVLEIVSVRVECVQEISETDARAEGFADSMAFKDAWEGMYGKKLGAALWSWCWVVEFKPTEVAAQGITMPKGSSPIETDGCAS